MADLTDDELDRLVSTLRQAGNWHCDKAAATITALRARIAELEAVARHRLAGVKAGLDTAANLCGALAETTYDSADAFDAAVGCESFIRAIDPASVGADHDAA